MADEVKQMIDGLKEAITMGKNLEEVKKELNLSKTEKASIDRNLNLIKKEIEELRAVYAKEANEKKDELARLGKLISEAQAKHAFVASQNQATGARLETLRIALDGRNKDVTRREENLEIRERAFGKVQSEVEDKKKILNQIKDLINKL